MFVPEDNSIFFSTSKLNSNKVERKICFPTNRIEENNGYIFMFKEELENEAVPCLLKK